MCIRSALETGRTCGGLKGMESEWPEKRMQAVLPFMAHMPRSYGEVAFRNPAIGSTTSARRPQGPPAGATGSPIDPHLAANRSARGLRRTASKVPWPPAKCCRQRLPEFAGCHDAPRCAAAGSPNRRGAIGRGHPDHRCGPDRPGRPRAAGPRAGRHPRRGTAHEPDQRPPHPHRGDNPPPARSRRPHPRNRPRQRPDSSPKGI